VLPDGISYTNGLNISVCPGLLNPAANLQEIQRIEECELAPTTPML
jgi:hypothetical protein